MTITDLRRVEQQEEATEKRRFGYVPSLDGLRGLAVVGVLLYHLDVAWIGDAGPIGVEVFFVISGFLITTLLIIERENNDRISIKGFWNRRARRLVPALFAMIALVLVWSLLPEPFGPTAVERGRTGGDGVASALYVSNWWYVFSGQSYFEQFGNPSPFRHTWSLSVEEQFYLIVAMGLAAGFAVWGVKRRRWIVLALGGAALSAAWMMFLTRMGDLVAEGLWPFGIDPAGLPEWLRTFLNFQGGGDPSRVYYGTDTRLFAVLIGVALAFILQRIDLPRRLPYLAAELGGLLSIAGLAALMVFTPRGAHWMYYGGFLLVDLLTVTAIVCVQSSRRTVARDVTAWKPLVFVGVISYGLYVFHFPLFIILNDERMPIHGWPLNVLRLAVTFLVAFVSYRYYEQPLRARGLPSVRSRWIAGGVAATLLVGLVVVSTTSGDSSLASGADAGADVNAASTDGRPVVMVAGDSQAFSFGGGAYNKKADVPTGLAIRLATKLGCGITEADFIIGGNPQKQSADCLAWRTTWAKQVQTIDPAVTVVMVWSWEIYDRRVLDADGNFTEVRVGTPEWERLFSGAVQEAIGVLTAGGGKVVLATMPCIDFDAHKKAPKTEPDAPARVKELNRVLAEVAARNAGKGVSLIDTNKLLCPDGENYRGTIDGVVMTDDGVHFSKDGAVVLWNWMAPQLRKLTGQG
jgi:peptidoglycan/LPS O-acetylase OafA/YrhL